MKIKSCEWRDNSTQNRISGIVPTTETLRLFGNLLDEMQAALAAQQEGRPVEGLYFTSIPQVEDPMQHATEPNLIKGIDGLAEYFGCCHTTAQKIANSGILQRAGILYRMGRGLRARKDKLDAFLAQNPNALGQV